MTIETTLPFVSPQEKLKLLFRLHVARITITNTLSGGGGEDEESYSVCMERNGKFQTTKEVKAVSQDQSTDKRSMQTCDFNETISLVR